MDRPELELFRGCWDFKKGYPRMAIRKALENPAAAIPELHAILQYTLADAETIALTKGACLHIAATYLLACFRDRKALDWLIPLLCQPQGVSEHLFGDVITEDLKLILASLSHGDPQPVLSLITDPDADSYARVAALESLVISVHVGELARQRLVDILLQLLAGELVAPDHSYFWSVLPICCEQIHPAGLFEAMDEAVRKGYIAVQDFDRALLQDLLTRPVKVVMDEYREEEAFRLVNNADVENLEQWLCSRKFVQTGNKAPAISVAPQPYPPVSPELRQKLTGIDNWIAEGGRAMSKDRSVDACVIWLKAWEAIKTVMREEDLSSLEDLQPLHPWSEFLINFVQDLEMELGNAALQDSAYHTARIVYCTELLEWGGLQDHLSVENTRRAIAEAHFAKGDTEACDRLFEGWLQENPDWTWGYIGWADCWTGQVSSVKDMEKAEAILRKGLARKGLEERADLLERAVEVYRALGDDASAEAYRKELQECRRREERRRDEEVRELIRFMKPAVKAPPKKEMTKKEPIPVVVHPNNFCPCGSGKKYKKCCMPTQQKEPT